MVSAMLGGTPRLRAQDDAGVAKAHYNKATRFYEVGDYQQALDEFKAAHMAKADPAFLYNIAQCHRQLGHAEQAITLYKRYLAASPKASNRAEVEKRIADLESGLAAKPPSAPAAPEPQTSAFTPYAAPEPAPAPVAAPETVTQAEAATASSGWRFLPWIGVGVTLALVGGAVATGLSASSRYDDLQNTCGKGPPGCSESDIDRVKSRALWANLLWGAAGVAAVGTGLSFVLTPHESAVQVAWRF
jgi:tetratricopeptide (TPR) repeat protein